MHNKKIVIAVVAFIVILSITMPSILISINERRDIGKVEIDENIYYYHGATDTDIDFFERLKLVSNQLESNVSESIVSSSYRSFNEVVAMAEDGINDLYEIGYYPVAVKSTYDNWYSPEISLYKCTDSYFSRYICYVWLVKLTKYDNSEVHYVLIDDKSKLIMCAKCKYSNDQSDVLNEGKLEPLSLMSHYKTYNSVKYYKDVTDDNEFEQNIDITSYSLIDPIKFNDKRVSIYSEENIENYTQAENEIKNAVDNDKYIVIIGKNKKEYYYQIVPFNIITKEEQ